MGHYEWAESLSLFLSILRPFTREWTTAWTVYVELINVSAFIGKPECCYLQAAGFSVNRMDPSRVSYGCLYWKTCSGTIYRHGMVYVELINVSAFTGKPECCYLQAVRFRVNSMDPSRFSYSCLFWKTCSGTIYSHRIDVQNLPAIYLSRIPNSAVQVVIHTVFTVRRKNL